MKGHTNDAVIIKSSELQMIKSITVTLNLLDSLNQFKQQE